MFGNLIADEEPYDRKTLFRLGSWGVAASVGLVLAIAVSQSPLAERRTSLASAADVARQTQRIQLVADGAALENRRLTAATETLQGDRDRLYARVTNLEQTLTALQSSVAVASLSQEAKPAAKQDNIPVASVETTGPAPASTARSEASAEPAKQVAAAAEPAATGSIDRTAGPEKKPAAEAVAAAPTETPVLKTEFGVDLGTASSIQGLRALWAGMTKSNNALLGSLRPIVAIKERSNGLGMQLRLVAGPLTDAAAAARLCAALAIRNNECDTTVFDGQRLSIDAKADTKADGKGDNKGDAKNAALGDTSAEASQGEKSHVEKSQAAPAKRTVRRRAATPVRRAAPPPPSPSFFGR